ncbi:clathrin light chain A-like isoform X7 [Mizuhopecten yessoensis]|uniref:clathrin light chain A-like isoform X7 n=1 Tax=Mizuhopecten yessoensis TaxID=6573 RepID=UPI000B45DBA4|nr:clathrin light chain A-like isoform X7 [Mizuhopecten yessoensis]
MADADFMNPEPTEEDPAAAFLAREQTELAGLEDDNFGVDSSAPQQQNDNFDPFTGGASEQQEGDFMGNQTNAPPDMYSIISQADRERNEPEKIRIWREEQVLKLEAKDKEEDNKQEEMRDSAKKELDDWYKHNLEQLEKTKENNRAAEEAFVKDRDETQPGGEWEKICRLCEFNPKNSKNTKDVSRMRGILLQLKQTPLVR